MQKSQKSPLYRRVNTTAHCVRHLAGGSFADERNTKQTIRSEASRQSMGGKKRRGLDYTPLFKFLLSKVGHEWNAVHAEAVRRLDRSDPIFWLVALHEHERKDCVCIDSASLYSGLYVDEAGLLQVVNPAFNPYSLAPFCRCCTHTFNGVRLTPHVSSLRTSILPEQADTT
ncbi:MAG: hypothetical protein FWH15_04315 [Betaproteobacteria bacterium]|nr:hypothetical protein [Betaproteobacteria bacterium]